MHCRGAGEGYGVGEGRHVSEKWSDGRQGRGGNAITVGSRHGNGCPGIQESVLKRRGRLLTEDKQEVAAACLVMQGFGKRFRGEDARHDIGLETCGAQGTFGGWSNRGDAARTGVVSQFAGALMEGVDAI